MAERICVLCGHPASGWASVWTAATGEQWYCHGDDDEEPTCYERRGATGAGSAAYLDEYTFYLREVE